MLQYQNILSSKDKEIIDPVSGNSYPYSFSDMQRERQLKFDENRSKDIAASLISVIK